MAVVDRRKFVLAALCGAGAALALAPSAAAALPLGAGEAGRLVDPLEDEVKPAQVVVAPRRRRRRWVCWWHRGRRICGWRWV